ATSAAVRANVSFRGRSGHQRRRETDCGRRRSHAPEDKFNFSPETLNIPGGDYKGVRSFAVEVKHVAASNWFIWSPLTGEKLPEGLGDDGNGPANKKTKAEIIKFLKDSFALGHRAAATLTTENMLQAPGKSKSTRLRLAEFGVSHAYN